MAITYRSNLEGVNWDALRKDLIEDDFHNGRTSHQLKLSFENSAHQVLARDKSRVIATARLLSDGVGNAYIVDVWTQKNYQRQGIASRLIKMLIEAVPGQHIYLQTDEDALPFYKHLGFKEQPRGLSLISGNYLDNRTRDNSK